MTVPAQDGDLYFTYETYFPSMIPRICSGLMSLTFDVQFFKNEQLMTTHHYDSEWNVPIQVLEADYSAGDVFRMNVDINWYYNLWFFGPMDYTVMVYSKQNIDVKDASGSTNQIDMPGTY